jgi:hypothetical protein
MIKHNNSSGFSIVELLISMGIGVALLSFSSSFVLRALSVSKVVKSRSLIGDIENRIRYAANSSESLNHSATFEPKLSACLESDGVICNSTLAAESFPIYLSNGTRRLRLTGTLSEQGAPCTLGCPILVRASFKAECGLTSTCDKARSILVIYDILVDSIVVRSGAIYHRVDTVETVEAEDGAYACGFDKATGLPMFAESAEPLYGKINCVAMPGISKTVSGVTPGDCIAGKEVLIGFDPVTTAKICAPAVMTK